MNRSRTREKPTRSQSPSRPRSASRKLQSPTTVSLSQEVQDPTPDVGEWRRTLRSPSPSSIFTARSYEGSLRLSPVSSRKEQKTFPLTTDSADFENFRKNLDRSLNDTADLEQEYIASLRQQIQILELDNKFLREQGMKITEMHPVMKMEAEAMLAQLREMQKKSDAFDLEIFRKNADVDRLSKVYSHLSGRAKDDIDVAVKEKSNLVEDAARLKAERDAGERQHVKLDLILRDLQNDQQTNLTSLRTADTKAEALKAKLESERGTTQNLERQLLELRERLAGKMAELTAAERKALSLQPLPEDERLQHEMRAEIDQLRSELAQRQNQVGSDSGTREELSLSVSRLSKENVNLSHLLTQMRCDLERARSLRGKEASERNQQGLAVSRLASSCAQLSGENERLKAELGDARASSLQALDSLKLREARAAASAREGSLSQQRLVEVEKARRVGLEANAKLQREKDFLAERAAALERKLKERSDEALGLDQHATSLARRIAELERLTKVEQSVQSQRWSELSRLADDIRGFARRGRPTENGATSHTLNGDYNPGKYAT